MATTKSIESCRDLADRQAEMFSRIRFFSNMKLQERQISYSSSTTKVAREDSITEFFNAVFKVLEEHLTVSDVLLRSIEGITESWLTPEAIEAKKQHSKLWKDLKGDLFKGQIEELKNMYRNGLVIKGTPEKSVSTPVVGVLLASKRTATDMQELESGIPAWEDSISKASKMPRISKEELEKATGDDYRIKLQYWGPNWSHISTVGLQNDKALVEYTRNIEGFWMIETMGVLEGERGKGVGRRMIEEVKKKAEADRLPIIVNANREAVGFYKRCGFSTLGMFTYVGESRENHIMQWVWETTIKGEH